MNYAFISYSCISSPIPGSPFIPAMLKDIWLLARLALMLAAWAWISQADECCLCCYIVSLFVSFGVIRTLNMTYVFKTVQVLVSLVAILALMGLFLLHPCLTRIRCRGLRIDNGERTVSILVELLVLMPVLFVIPA